MKLLVFLIILLFLLVKPAEALPVWSQNQAYVPPNSQYSPRRVYTFQINWEGSNESYTVSNVLFESDFSGSLNNATVSSISENVYQVNFTDLPARNYVYRWYAVDNESNWNLTEQWSYSINKNSSMSINLYLNGIGANKNYNLNDLANFTVFLNIPNKLVNLSSTYNGFVQQSSSSSAIYNLTNLSSPGSFSATGWWEGDENYSSSSKTYYFDNTPPSYSGMITYPVSPVAYSYGMLYTFNIIWADIILSHAWFESNHTGSFVNYTMNTVPQVQNTSNNFYITLTSLPARTFVYRWIANDSINKISATSQTPYYILKSSALSLDVVPSRNVVNGTSTVVICRSFIYEVDVSNFKLFRNSILIGNDTTISRRDNQTLGVGIYEYVCSNTETQNFTNQTLKLTLNVSLDASLQNLTRTLNLAGPSPIQMGLGESSEKNFYLENNLGESLNNISLAITGIPLSWYSIGELPSSIPNNFSLLMRIAFSIPSDAQQGDYNVTLRATSKTASDETKTVVKSIILSISTTPPVQNFPPIYSTFSTSTTSHGNLCEFSLKWNDDNELSGYIFSSNITGMWLNDSWASFSGKESFSYASKNLTIQPNSVVAWKVYANDSSDLWADSEEFYLKVTEREKADILLPVLMVSVFIICLALILLIANRKKSKSKVAKKENVTYVYRKEDLK
jgi:hypothetical protein